MNFPQGDHSCVVSWPGEPALQKSDSVETADASVPPPPSPPAMQEAMEVDKPAEEQVGGACKLMMLLCSFCVLLCISSSAPKSTQRSGGSSEGEWFVRGVVVVHRRMVAVKSTCSLICVHFDVLL